MTITEEQSGESIRGPSETNGVIDCDVHPTPKSAEILKQYMAPRWHAEYDRGSCMAGIHGGQIIGARPQFSYRADAFPAEGPPGSDLDLMRIQLLDPYDVEKAILIPLEILGRHLYGDFSSAFCAAVNDWLVESWLDRDQRLYGAISIPLEDGPRSVREIERVAAASDRFVQVLLTTTTREGLGHPKYWPIYEAAVDAGLPVGAHISGFSGTGGATGWPSYFFEYMARYTQPAQAQVVSLVHSGVFEAFPTLRFVLAEQGLGWLPPLMWRLDRCWEEIPDEWAHLKVPPSELIRKHFWLTTQPMDVPQNSGDLVRMLEHLAMDDRVMFSSDYPHFDFDDPRRAIPSAVVRGDLRSGILSANAAALYPFPAVP